VLADVARGTWKPAGEAPAPVGPVDVPSFHDYADQWWLLHEGQLAPKTRIDYKWRLEVHLIPAFGETALDRITFDTVERYMAAKVADGLAPRTINMTLLLLAAILETAVERELIARNPAKGRGRRMRERAPRRSYLETAGQIEALLDAAGELDREPNAGYAHLEHRAMLATLTFAGLRIGELCALKWRDVDLAGGWLSVGESKTDAGRRRIKLRGALRDELLALRARWPDAAPEAPVFPTRTGNHPRPVGIRSRTLRRAVKRANENLAAKDLPPLPESLTPHNLRRTFATVLYALGEVPPVVMAEMGHTSPNLALRIYAQVMRLSDDEREQLGELVAGEKAHKGTRGQIVPIRSARTRVA
jgi:integrase